MDKVKLIETVSKGSHVRKTVDPELVIGDTSKGYAKGLILDANTVEKLIEDKIAAIVNGADSSHDTLKELEDSIPTKVSLLTNDTGYVNNSTVISNQPFPSDWPTAGNKTFNDLIEAIDNDTNAVKGKVYLSTVHYSDLPDSLSDAELKVEIMDSTGSHKIAVFTLTSANQSPYNWHTTMLVGLIEDWYSYALVEIEPIPIDPEIVETTPAFPWNSGATQTILMNTEVTDSEIIEHLKLDPPQGYPYEYSIQIVNEEICIYAMPDAIMLKLRNNTAVDNTITTYDWTESAGAPGIHGVSWI